MAHEAFKGGGELLYRSGDIGRVSKCTIADATHSVRMTFHEVEQSNWYTIHILLSVNLDLFDLTALGHE